MPSCHIKLSAYSVYICSGLTDQSAPYTTVLWCLDRSPAVFNSVLRCPVVVCVFQAERLRRLQVARQSD